MSDILDTDLIELAKRKSLEKKIVNALFYHANIWDPKLIEESFDVVLSFNILHLIEDPEKVIQRINKLLKPGGLFISITPCMGEDKSFSNKLLFLISKIGLLPEIIHFKISDLEDHVTKGGFKIVESEKLNNSSQNYYILAENDI